MRQGWRCLAYCLIDNHVHLLIETPAPNLGRGIHWLDTPRLLDFFGASGG